MFNIHMGVPEMSDFWDDLKKKAESPNAKKKDKDLYKKIVLSQMGKKI